MWHECFSDISGIFERNFASIIKQDSKRLSVLRLLQNFETPPSSWSPFWSTSSVSVCKGVYITHLGCFYSNNPSLTQESRDLHINKSPTITNSHQSLLPIELLYYYLNNGHSSETSSSITPPWRIALKPLHYTKYRHFCFRLSKSRLNKLS